MGNWEPGEIIYVLSSGEYSDYHVLCACPSKEDAEALAARYNAGRGPYGDAAGVEELQVFGPDTQQVEILSLSTTLWDNGTESNTTTNMQTVWPFAHYEGIPSAVSWRWVRAPMHRNAGGRLDVKGTDHERVRKVFSDRRAEILADETGQLRKVAVREGGR